MIKVDIVFSISNFFIDNQANNWSAKKVPSCMNLALKKFIFFLGHRQVETLLAEPTKAIQRYPWNVQSNSTDVMHMVKEIGHYFLFAYGVGVAPANDMQFQLKCHESWLWFLPCIALPFSSGAGNVSYTPASLLPGSGVTKSKLLYCYRRLLIVQCGEPRRLVWRKF